MHRVKEISTILKCLQWTKNFLLFVPAFFAAVDWTPELVYHLFLAFFAFSCVASSVYVLNDWQDRFYDLRHPQKKHKLGDNSISTSYVMGLSALLLIFGLSCGFYLSNRVGVYLVLYWVLNLCYTFYLKRIPLFDLLPLILGYQLRLLIGGEIANGPPSLWLIAIIVALSLVLILQKRQYEVLVYLDQDIVLRPTIFYYSKLPLSLIIKVLYFFIALLYLSYCIFIIVGVDQKWPIIITVPLVFYCLFQFWKLSKNTLFKDALILYFTNWIFMLSTFIWLLIFYIALYQ